MNRPGKCVPSCISLPEASFRKGLKTLPSSNDLSEATTTVIVLELDSWGMNSRMVCVCLQSTTISIHLSLRQFHLAIFTAKKDSLHGQLNSASTAKKKKSQEQLFQWIASSIQVLGSSFTCKHSLKREKSSE